MTDGEPLAGPGAQDDYTWLIETSNDGATWWPESHPVHGDRYAGGIEPAPSAEDLARQVLTRRFAGLRADTTYAWEELRFRSTVWDHRNAVDYAGPHQPPYPPDQAGVDPQAYGRYLQAHRAMPYAVEVRTPRQVHAVVWSPPTAVS